MPALPSQRDVRRRGRTQPIRQGLPGFPAGARPTVAPPRPSPRLTAPTTGGGVPVTRLPGSTPAPRVSRPPTSGRPDNSSNYHTPSAPSSGGRGRNIARTALRGARQGGGDGRGPAPAASSSPRGGGRSTPSPAQRAVSARLTTSASSEFKNKPKPRRSAEDNFSRFDNNPNRKPSVLRRAMADREKTGLPTASFAKGERERFIKNYRATHKNRLSDAQITLIGRYLKSKGKGKALFAQHIDLGEGRGRGGY